MIVLKKQTPEEVVLDLFTALKGLEEELESIGESVDLLEMKLVRIQGMKPHHSNRYNR